MAQWSFRGTVLPAGLVLRLDRSRRTAAATQPTTAPDLSSVVIWRANPGAGRTLDQPVEWAWPQFRRLDQTYRNFVTDRLLLPWWLLVLLLGAAPARWIFVRLRRAYRADHGRCPACGQGLELVEGGRCAACGTATAEIAA